MKRFSKAEVVRLIQEMKDRNNTMFAQNSSYRRGIVHNDEYFGTGTEEPHTPHEKAIYAAGGWYALDTLSDLLFDTQQR